MKTILSFMLAISLFSAAGCDSKKDQPAQEPQTSQTQTKQDTGVDKSDAINIRIVLENGKEMKAALYPNVAPKSVENFVKLINAKFYDGLIFHRVIDGFMIQAGGYDKTFYDGDFTQKDAESIKGEFSANGVKNNLKHTRGILSMARTNDPNSASSQFFIMHADAASLDGQYAAFGEITEGLDVVDEIAGTATKSLDGSLTYQGQKYQQTMDDVPAQPIVIKTIEIIK